MNRTARRAAAAAAREHVATFPEELTEFPRDQWPAWPAGQSAPPIKVWRSRRYLVQLYADGRIAIRGTAAEKALEVTWSEIQDVKRAIGFGDQWAVEFYPADAEVVDVAPMRWLWLTREPAYHLGKLPGTRA